ncbi:SoxR reducing system RseC family protein [Mangrovibacterium diazotrophicum]|uniref:RseC/MucC-like positive regulator of sigma(E) n=1 Tax=Mangrovibacterium diazotrophicum TaxID=1261403 RepID=A0A419W3U7_9BACT|nr:SoxR reducing system RseC family protein [Mangrovibacterium diazotrophicum]RKD90155.1 RseC/MucC-like positive regulator of sigma(E) [Mangrovibacterium diazotrophicum]
MSGEITHTGIVKKLSEKGLIVSIINESACASCHAKGACTAADMKDKEVEIHHFDGEYSVGQHVSIIGKTEQGFKALFWGYLLPFLLVLTILIVSTSIGLSEGISGLSAIAVLVPYYLFLYLFRNKMKKSFEFEIKPL